MMSTLQTDPLANTIQNGANLFCPMINPTSPLCFDRFRLFATTPFDHFLINDVMPPEGTCTNWVDVGSR
jgi:hypothetical protein